MEAHVTALPDALSLSRLRAPIALLGLLWNLYGVAQLWGTLRPVGGAAGELAMAAARDTTLTCPLWMTLAFAVGVSGGTLGSALLLGRSKASVVVFARSLAGY